MTLNRNGGTVLKQQLRGSSLQILRTWLAPRPLASGHSDACWQTARPRYDTTGG